MSMRVRCFLPFILCLGLVVPINLTVVFAQSDLGTISGFVSGILRVQPFRMLRSPSTIKLA